MAVGHTNVAAIPSVAVGSGGNTLHPLLLGPADGGSFEAEGRASRILPLAMVIDFVAVFLAYWLSQFAIGPDRVSTLHAPQPIAAVLAILVTCVFSLYGLYGPTVLYRSRPDFALLLRAWFAAFAAAAAIGLALLAGAIALSGWRTVTLAGAPLAPLLLLPLGGCTVALGRLVWSGYVSRQPDHAVQRPGAVVIGPPDAARAVARGLRRIGSYRVVGLLTDPRGGAVPAGSGIPVLGDLERLPAIAGQYDVRAVFIAGSSAASDLTLRVIAQAMMVAVDVLVVARAAAAGHSALDKIGGRPVTIVVRRPISGISATIKRAEDLILGGLALIALLPVLLPVAFAVRLSSPGPALFKQPRVGLNGRVFQIYKFRTMYVHQADYGADRQTSRRDPRITKIGAVLRRHSLDELPQLLNVLAGDMSLVGPRPHALSTKVDGMLLHQAVPAYPARHRVRPGITGWAQVNGWRGEIDAVHKIVKRVELDLAYVDTWSLWLDFRILAKTAICLVADRHAY